MTAKSNNTIEKDITKQEQSMEERKIKGVIFDMDGVLTQTSELHDESWEIMFNEFFKKLNQKSINRNDPDYSKYIEGQPRLEAIQKLLASRGMTLPMGTENDDFNANTVQALAKRKNEEFHKILKRRGSKVFNSSIDFVKELKENGYKVGVASSSRNAKLILESSKIKDLFDVCVDGEDINKLKLKGKPNPDIFILAAKEMGLKPEECAVVEDAVAGIEAAKKGNFGLAIGIARRGSVYSLMEQSGADVIINDMDEYSLSDLEKNVFVKKAPREPIELPPAVKKEEEPSYEALREYKFP